MRVKINSGSFFKIFNEVTQGSYGDRIVITPRREKLRAGLPGLSALDDVGLEDSREHPGDWNHPILRALAASNEDSEINQINLRKFQPEEFLFSEAGKYERRYDCMVADPNKTVLRGGIVGDLQEPQCLLSRKFAGDFLRVLRQFNVCGRICCQTLFSNAPVEKDFERLVVGTTRCRTPVTLGSAFENPTPDHICCCLLDLNDTAVFKEEPQRVAVAPNSIRRKPSRMEGVGVEVLLE